MCIPVGVYVASQSGPQRIVCLTEEPTEILYLLGEEHRIVGITVYTVRPPEARERHPMAVSYTHLRAHET